MKKKMFIAGMSFVVALVLLVTASFAWYTLSLQPEVTMQVAMYSDRTLLLAQDKNGKPGEFSQYLSLSENFAGLAPLRPVSTGDGINWFLPTYNTQTGNLNPVSEFIKDNTLQYANVSVTDSSGKYLSGDNYNAVERNGYYVYTDIWMKTEEEEGANVRLSVPALYGTAEERQAGQATGEFGLTTEEIQGAVYGTYVIGEPELTTDAAGNKHLAERTVKPETAIRVGFLVYQNAETLEPGSDYETLPFTIYEPNAGQRASDYGTTIEYVVPDSNGDKTNQKTDYISGGVASVDVMAEGNYVITQPIVPDDDGYGTIGSIDPANLIIQNSSVWDETETVKTLSGERENGNTRPNSNDIATFGQFIKTDERYAIEGDVQTTALPIEGEDAETDIAGSHIIVTLKKDTPIRVRIFIWIEGQDIDCWNDIAAGTCRINLELAGETILKEEPKETVIATLNGYGTGEGTSDGWFDGTKVGITRNEVTEVTFTDTEPAEYDTTWTAGTTDGDDVIKAYRSGTEIYIVLPEGADKIRLPEDSDLLFGNMNNCVSITGLPEYVDTSAVTTMATMFASDLKLVDVDLSGFDTSNVTDMSGMFGTCVSLPSLDLSGFDTSKVTAMNGMFYQCGSLQQIYGGDGWDTSAVEQSGAMFYYCTSLVGGNGTEYNSEYTDKAYAHIDRSGNPGYFTDKNASSTVVCTLKGHGEEWDPLSGWISSFIAGIERNEITELAFTDTVPDGYTRSWIAGQDTGYATINAYLYSGTKVAIVVPQRAEKIRLPQDSARLFESLSSCTSITGLDKLDTSDVTDMNGMFRYCTSLTELDLSSWDTSNVTDMTAMFDSAVGLNVIYVGDKWSTESVTSSGHMFEACYNLTGGNGTGYDGGHADAEYARIDKAGQPGYFSKKTAYDRADLTLSHFNTWIYDYDYHLGSIGSITFSKTAPDSYDNEVRVDIGSGAAGLTAYCSGDYGTQIVIVLPEGADKLYFPEDSSGLFGSMIMLGEINGMELVDTSYVTDMSGMFLDTDELTELDLSSWNTSNVTNMTGMFSHATGTETIYVTDKWSTEAVTSASNMFTRCDILVGGNGTEYSAAHTDAEYARIDTEGTPGYFTHK